MERKLRRVMAGGYRVPSTPVMESTAPWKYANDLLRERNWSHEPTSVSVSLTVKLDIDVTTPIRLGQSQAHIM